MQAITRGWVVQVTPVHESSSPRAARFCFKFYTVTCGRGGQGGRGTAREQLGTAREQLGPACAQPRGPSTASQAAEENRHWFWFHQLTSSASWAFGRGEGSRLAFWGGRRVVAFAACVSTPRSCHRETSLRVCSFWSELTFLLVLKDLFQALLPQFPPPHCTGSLMLVSHSSPPWSPRYEQTAEGLARHWGLCGARSGWCSSWAFPPHVSCGWCRVRYPTALSRQ